MFLVLLACTSHDSSGSFASNETDDSSSSTDSIVDSVDSEPLDSDSATDSGKPETGETGETAETGDTVETADTNVSTVGTCREGMPFIDTMPSICFTPYEVSIVSYTTLGDADTLASGAEQPTDVVIVSEAGQIPATGISSLQAAAICEQQGDGWHLMTEGEFRAAGDGILGEEESNYPYGNTYDSTACNTEGDESSDLALTGSYPKCVSASGGWDFVGNAWTWTFSGKYILPSTDVIAAMNARAIGIVLDTDGRVVVGEVDMFNFKLTVAGAGDSGIERSRDADGVYTVTFPDASSWEWDKSNPVGYLVYNDSTMGGEGSANPENDLMVEIVPDSGVSDSGFSAHLEPTDIYAGYPMTAKKGGSTYTGSETLDEVTYEHVPPFTGTIGFYCSVWTE